MSLVNKHSGKRIVGTYLGTWVGMEGTYEESTVPATDDGVCLMDCSFQAKNHVHSTFLEHIYDDTMLTSVVDSLHSFSLVSFSSLFFLFFSSPLLPSSTTWLTTYQVSKAHQPTTPTHFIPLLFILSFSLLCFCADAGANKFIWR